LGPGRPERSLAASAHVFYPLIAIGLISLLVRLNSVIKISKKFKLTLKYSLILLFIIFVFSFNFNPAYSQLKGAYNGVIRVTPVQYEVGEWIRDNTAFNANISTVGVLIMQKDRWMRYIAWRYIRAYKPEHPSPPDYMLIDYSDFAAIGDMKKLQEIALFEEKIKVNNTVVYDEDNIKVYKIESRK